MTPQPLLANASLDARPLLFPAGHRRMRWTGPQVSALRGALRAPGTGGADALGKALSDQRAGTAVQGAAADV